MKLITGSWIIEKLAVPAFQAWSVAVTTRSLVLPILRSTAILKFQAPSDTQAKAQLPQVITIDESASVVPIRLIVVELVGVVGVVILTLGAIVSFVTVMLQLSTFPT